MANIKHTNREAEFKLQNALERLHGGYADNTLRAYKSDFEAFIKWCESRDLCPLPASPETVSAFVTAEAEIFAPATIRRRVVSIGRIHRFSRHPDPSKGEEVYLGGKPVPWRVLYLAVLSSNNAEIVRTESTPADLISEEQDGVS